MTKPRTAVSKVGLNQLAKKRATANPAPKKPRTAWNKSYTVDEMLIILDKTIKSYSRSKSISYHKILNNLSTLSKSAWANYMSGGIYPNTEIQAKFQILKEIQEDKAVDGAMSGKYNSTFAAFLLRTRHGYVEQQHTDRLAFEKEKLAAASLGDGDQPININFTIAEHRSEEQIDRLLEDQ